MPAYLQLNNIYEGFETDATVAIAHWGCALACWLRSHDGLVITAADVAEADHVAWEGSGLRCHAVDFLREQPSAVIRRGLDGLVKIALNMENPGVISDAVDDLQSIKKSLGKVLHWIAVDDFSALRYDHHLSWRMWAGRSIYLNKDLLTPPIARTIDRDTAKRLYRSGTGSQQRAMRELIELIRVKKAGKIFGGISPRTTALMVGMSGSGKTWVGETVANILGLPFFSATVGSWTLTGNNNAVGTVELLRRYLADNGPSLICIDEIDKIRQGRSDNMNYSSYIWDELMAILDCRVQVFGGWRSDEIADLRSSHIVAAGAFQDLYREMLDAEIMFEEQLEGLEPIDFALLTRVQLLPDELLNRLGSVIEIRPPVSDEIAERMATIENDAGVSVDLGTRSREAREIAIGCLGMRGLELYALRLAKESLSRERRPE